MKFNVEKAYYLFRLIRRSEEKIIELYHTDKIKSPVHLSIGQESIAVGVSMALDAKDVIFSNYRSHAHYIAREANLDKMWAELYGKQRGSARGKGGSMHLNDWSKNFMTTSAIVSSSVPEAVGFAYAIKYKKQNNIVICYHGDGATEEGVFWESMNFASLHKLPIIFICENNEYAIYTHQSKRTLNDPIVERANAFGINSKKIRSSETQIVFNEVVNCINNIKSDAGPQLLEFMTTRWKDHVGVGDALDLNYRDKKEISLAINEDDLKKLEELLPSQKVEKVNKKVEEKLNMAIEFAEKCNFPDSSELTENVYG